MPKPVALIAVASDAGFVAVDADNSVKGIGPVVSGAVIGFYAGAGAPTGISAAKGSVYMNTTASSTTTRLYINTDGGTTWTTVTTAA